MVRPAAVRVSPRTGGSVSCNGLTCVPSCSPGSKLCNDSCIPDSDSCDGVCPGGSHDCEGVCLDDDSTQSCGASCTACAEPPSNGYATCDGTNCGIDCDSGFHACGDICVTNGTPGTAFVDPVYGCGHRIEGGAGGDWITFVSGLHVGYGWYPTGASLNLTDATEACDDLTLAGLSGWVLPSIDHMRTLLDGCSGNESGGACRISDPGCLDELCGTDAACPSCPGGAGPNNGAYCRANVPICTTTHTSSSCFVGCGSNTVWHTNISNGDFGSHSMHDLMGAICVQTSVSGY